MVASNAAVTVGSFHRMGYKMADFKSSPWPSMKEHTSVKGIIQRCLFYKPNARPTCKQPLARHWLRMARTGNLSLLLCLPTALSQALYAP